MVRHNFPNGKKKPESLELLIFNEKKRFLIISIFGGPSGLVFQLGSTFWEQNQLGIFRKSENQQPPLVLDY